MFEKYFEVIYQNLSPSKERKITKHTNRRKWITYKKTYLLYSLQAQQTTASDLKKNIIK